MSFSGLKTAIIREVARLKQAEQFNDNTKSQLAYEVQESITDILVAKTISAAEQYNVKSILLGGGVAANQRLTEKMKSGIKNLELNIQSYIPSPNLCTDNGAAIASFAYFHNHPVPWKDVQADPDVEIELES
jgi:N6-L-threonylcarbamoyladenine synthase